MKHLPYEDGTPSMTANSAPHRFSARHINPGCDCRTLEAPNGVIAGILRSGGIPILRIETTKTDKLTLRAKQWDGRAKYIVIQHTQMDGLASSRYGTMTTCQLMMVAYRMGKLQVEEMRGEQLYFWLDTLCEDKARASPSTVFEQAHAVLVVDTALQGLRTADDFADLPSHLADLMGGHPRLALSARLLLLNAYYGYIDMHARRDKLGSIKRQQRQSYNASDYEVRRLR